MKMGIQGFVRFASWVSESVVREEEPRRPALDSRFRSYF